MKNVIINQKINQERSTDFLKIVNPFKNFVNTNTQVEINSNGHREITFYGCINDKPPKCKCCGSLMHKHSSHTINLKHIATLDTYIKLSIDHTQYYCPNCKNSISEPIDFKVDNHLITKQLYNTIEDYLSTNKFTIKMISKLTGVGRNIIKEIDKKRLEKLYLDKKGNIKKPITKSSFLAIDEFSLHKGHKYATHIIDLTTGHILWISLGKKKQVVYDFLEHVGEDFANNIKAIACDMNSNFAEAFKEKYPHIQIVYDYFHIVKNFNDKVINEVRKDEIKRLNDIGETDKAKKLKGSKYILMSSKETLSQKDKEAQNKKIISKESILYKFNSYIRKFGYIKQYNKLIKENKLFFTIDLIKENLSVAFKCNSKVQMQKEIKNIIKICKATQNKHFIWFAKLLNNHLDGIIAHAKYKISTGKIEGINNKIKTIRRQSYGFRDDDYFFLKVLDISRNYNNT